MNVKKQKKNAILNPQRNVIVDLLGDNSLLIFVRKGHNLDTFTFYAVKGSLCFSLTYQM